MTQPPNYQGPPPQSGGDYGAGGYGQPAKPDNNLVWAILSTILCCLPFGIVSIVYAAKVDGLWASGDYAGARAASDDARKWAMISAVAAAVSLVGFFVLFAGLGATTLRSG